MTAQPFKEVPRKSHEQCCQYSAHIFPFLSPFLLSLISAFPVSTSLFLPPHLSLPGLSFLFSGLWPDLKTLSSRGRVWLGIWQSIFKWINECRWVWRCTMSLCNVMVNEVFAKLFLIRELISLRSSVCSLNSCNLDFFCRRSMDPEVRLRFESKCCDCLAVCLLRRLLYLPGFLFPCKQNERIDLPTSRASSFKSLWHSLSGWDSPDLLSPRFKLNDWVLFLPSQNVLVPNTKIIQMYYSLPFIDYSSSAVLWHRCHVRFAPFQYWKTKVQLCHSHP